MQRRRTLRSTLLSRRRGFLTLERLENRLALFGDSIAAATPTFLGPNPDTFNASNAFIGDGSYALNDVDLWKFSAVAGSVVTLGTSQGGGSNPADTYLRLFDAAGSQLTADDDNGPVQYSLISGFTLPSTGDFYVGVSVYNNSSYNPNFEDSGSGAEAGKDGDFDLSISIDLAPFTDIILQSVEAGVGSNALSVTYEIDNIAAAPFSVSFYRSPDAVFDGTDTLLDEIQISDPADLTVGTHTLFFGIGGGAGQVALPGAGVPETGGEYHLLAVADDQDAQAELDIVPPGEDNVAVIFGAYLGGSTVYAHGTTSGDSITVTQSASTYVVSINGGPHVFAPAAVNAVRIRAHAGGDAVNAEASSKPAWISGGDDGDSLIGSSVNDSLMGDGGNDFLAGGGGNDAYFFDADLPLGFDFLQDLSGIDSLNFAATNNANITVDLSSVSAQQVAPNLSLQLATGDSFENAIGGQRNNTLTGNELNNFLFGGPRTDDLRGLGGKDTLTGNAGDDVLRGGSGHDIYSFDADTQLGNDAVEELVGPNGRDVLDFGNTTTRAITLNLSLTSAQTVNSNLGLTLTSGSTFENVIGGALNDVLTGNNLANVLIGANGNDRLFGLSGRDILIGGLGADTVNGGGDQDIVIAGRYFQERNADALVAIITEWSRLDGSYENRVGHLNGTLAGGLQGNFRLKTTNPGITVGGDVNVDTLTGGGGRDWFFRKLGQDNVTDFGTVAPDAGAEPISNLP